MSSFRDIPGFPGYEVSDLGEIRRLARTDRLGRRVPERILTGYISDSRHRRYGIGGSYIDGHTAVLLAFVGPRPDGMEACHNNGNGLDNRLENLRWDTRQSNVVDKVNHGTHPFASRARCKSDHEYSPENTRIEIRNGARVRVCKACVRDRMRNHRAKAA